MLSRWYRLKANLNRSIIEGSKSRATRGDTGTENRSFEQDKKEETRGVGLIYSCNKWRSFLLIRLNGVC